MAVTSTAWAGAAPREEDVVEAAGGVGLVGAAVPTVLVGEATAGEVGTQQSSFYNMASIVLKIALLLQLNPL